LIDVKAELRAWVKGLSKKIGALLVEEDENEFSGED